MLTHIHTRQLCTLDSAETEQRVTSPPKTLGLDTHNYTCTVHEHNPSAIID